MSLTSSPIGSPEPDADPFAWLEDVDGEEAMAWVAARNADTSAGPAARPAFAPLRDAVREVLDSPARIPEVSAVGDLLYGFWRDAEHPRGLWRRTTPESYRREEPEWEIVLDLDALNAAEGEDWVWHGASVLRPAFTRALIALSHGGSDADVTRELDLVTCSWVEPVDGGFVRPEGKGDARWVDEDTLVISTDLGEGTTTTSGYARTVRRWRRGTPLTASALVFEGRTDDLAVTAWHDHTPGFERDLVVRALTFYSDELFLLDAGGTARLVEVPDSAQTLVHREWLLVELREVWAPDPDGPTHPAGSLLAARFDAWMAGERTLTVLFRPDASSSLSAVTWTLHHLVLAVLVDVRSTILVLTPPAADQERAPWVRSSIPGLPAMGSVSARAVDRHENDDLWVTVSGFDTPSTLQLVTVASGQAPVRVKAAPAFFDASGLDVSQYFAVSADGTRVPYFLLTPPNARRDGTAPTLLYGYGGFEVSLLPSYSGTLGRAWLDQGGVYAVANIRGGGEYGPTWHQAALRAERHRAYEDFAAVARDLVDRGVTTPAHLGAQGGSNGGLLAGNMLTRYPELFGAIVIQVPLLDMRRYSHLLAGASWMAEYGDPDDPEQWEFIRTFSPYHLLDAGRDYPPVLLTTSTRDDRVHPGHARKTAAWLRAAGKDVTYYENVEGGHGGAADNSQTAFMAALAWTFLAERLR